MSEGHHVLVAAVDIDRQTPVRELADQVRDAVRAVLGSCVVGTAANHVIVLAHGWASASPARVRTAFTEADELLRRGPGGSAVRTLGVATPDQVDVLASMLDGAEPWQDKRRCVMQALVLRVAC